MSARLFEQCKVYHLGLTPYTTAWELQNKLAEQIAAGKQPPSLLLLEHPHIFTFGRRGDPANLLWDAAQCALRGVQVLWVDRGGDVTYHGPGQVVGYPLLPLAPGGWMAYLAQAGEKPPALPKADYVGYLRKLEETIMLALARLGVASRQLAGKTGVWAPAEARLGCQSCAAEQRTKPAKIAAIGVKVDARGVSRHGFALNVEPEMSFYQGIISCGLAEMSVTSLAEILSPAPALAEVEAGLAAAFGEKFDCEMVEGKLDEIIPGVRHDDKKN